ncbi:MAG TPA: type II toxin-antitoxin system VapC family toxin [Dermatophilaceae bacterium]|nr:type II toxin-antitoxin system VapC family toxin [Dermatophilaceae bacterium]
MLGPSRSGDLDDLLEAAEAVIAPVGVDQLHLARVAHGRFGRGSGPLPG